MPFRHLRAFRPRLENFEPWRYTMAKPQHGLAAGDYVFLESYCDEKDCDCRRVWLTLIYREWGMDPGDCTGPLAVIGYGWEPPEFYEKWSPDDPGARKLAGARLEPFQQQGAPAEKIFGMTVSAILGTAANRKRIRAHYAAARAAVAAGTVRKG